MATTITGRSATQIAGQITGLHIYPLKSAAGLTLERATIAAGGLAWDRHWMAVDTRGIFLSQRVQPRLARIVPELTGSGRGAES